MANSADSDQLASSEANWSGSTLFANAGHIWVQQDKGWWVGACVKLNQNWRDKKKKQTPCSGCALLHAHLQFNAFFVGLH